MALSGTNIIILILPSANPLQSAYSGIAFFANMSAMMHNMSDILHNDIMLHEGKVGK